MTLLGVSMLSNMTFSSGLSSFEGILPSEPCVLNGLKVIVAADELFGVSSLSGLTFLTI